MGTRNPDAEAMCDLAMHNYIEMRDLVNKKSFLLRKKFDNLLHWLAPDWWVSPLHLRHILQDAIPSVHQQQEVARLRPHMGLLSSWSRLIGFHLAPLLLPEPGLPAHQCARQLA